MNTHARYVRHGDFFPLLRARVDEHFKTAKLSPHGTPGMGLKTFIIAGWFATSYLGLVAWASTPLQAVVCAASLGLAMAGIGFNIQHDGGHGGYSGHGWLNTVMAATLDVVGGSSYVWSWKHNILHHSHPNVMGLDSDIDVQPFCRLAPAQRLRSLHRFQHLYIWPLYSFLALKWNFVDDFHDLITGRIGGVKFPRPRGWKLAGLLVGKLVFMTWALVLPMFFHPWWQVLVGYVGVSALLSLVLAVTFQLAHSVEHASFPTRSSEGDIDSEWAVHQVSSSVDFAPGNALLTWYLGGLNHQIEHHLFPKICHVHLPALVPIVRATCAQFGVPYRSHPTARAAIASHARWVYAMGHGPLSQP